ncbi:NlpC/P60 family protein [Streptomyces sp. JNUCC 63]
MSGRVPRLLCSAAVAAQAALAPVAAVAVPGPPAVPTAPAVPGPPAVSAAPGPSAVPGPPAPGQRSVAELLTDLRTLYRQAEHATEAYNATEEQLKKQRAEVDRLDTALARAWLALDRSRAEAGRLARQQYQDSTTDLSSYLRLLMARDPQQALDEGHVIGQAARERAETVNRLTGSKKKADDLARAARKAYGAQLALARRQQRARDDVRGRLHGVERLLASLSAERLAALAAFEKNGIAGAQRAFLASGVLSGRRLPSQQGEEAVRYAVRQLGKPYQWGAAGPQAYDCSGLTSQAWGHAGTSIPRTSQEQWARLKRIRLNELRPGDLVVYFPEATHVALYLGDGMVVQAPRPGARVKVSPVAANPVLGAVRPDPGGAPLPRYVPPALPAGALTGPDAGLYAVSTPETSAR